MSYFIDVILPIPLEKLFTYQVTEAEAEFLKKGMRVSVPFGKSKIYTALVLQKHRNPPQIYEAKDIHQILDETPIVTSLQIKHWQWISKYYMCTLGEVMRAALPSAFILESETIISRNQEVVLNDEGLKDDEFLVYEALHHQSSLKIQDLMNILDKKNVLPVIKRLIDKNAISVQEEIYEKYKPKLVRYVKLNSKYTSESQLSSLLDELNRAPKQREVVMTLFSVSAKTKKPVKVSALSNESDSTSAIIKALIDKGVLEEYHIQKDRIQYSGEDNEELKELNTYQEQAFTAYSKQFSIQNGNHAPAQKGIRHRFRQTMPVESRSVFTGKTDQGIGVIGVVLFENHGVITSQLCLFIHLVQGQPHQRVVPVQGKNNFSQHQ